MNKQSLTELNTCLRSLRRASTLGGLVGAFCSASGLIELGDDDNFRPNLKILRVDSTGHKPFRLKYDRRVFDAVCDDYLRCDDDDEEWEEPPMYTYKVAIKQTHPKVGFSTAFIRAYDKEDARGRIQHGRKHIPASAMTITRVEVAD